VDGNKRGSFTKIEQRQAEQNRRDGRRDSDMRHLAEAAGRIILSCGVLVRRNLQQEEQ
jgi:hypothetical protein